MASHSHIEIWHASITEALNVLTVFIFSSYSGSHDSLYFMFLLKLNKKLVVTGGEQKVREAENNE